MLERRADNHALCGLARIASLGAHRSALTEAYVGYRIDTRARNPQGGSLLELNRLALRSMRYFFQLQNGGGISDTEGNEFPDDNAAMVEAAIVAKELGRHRSDAGAWRLVVTNL